MRRSTSYGASGGLNALRTGTFQIADGQVLGQIVAYRGNPSWVFMNADVPNYNGPVKRMLQADDGSTVAFAPSPSRAGPDNSPEHRLRRRPPPAGRQARGLYGRQRTRKVTATTVQDTLLAAWLHAATDRTHLSLLASHGVRNPDRKDDHERTAEQLTEPVGAVDKFFVGPHGHRQIDHRGQVRTASCGYEVPSPASDPGRQERDVRELNDRKAPRKAKLGQTVKRPPAPPNDRIFRSSVRLLGRLSSMIGRRGARRALSGGVTASGPRPEHSAMP